MKNYVPVLTKSLSEVGAVLMVPVSIVDRLARGGHVFQNRRDARWTSASESVDDMLIRVAGTFVERVH